MPSSKNARPTSAVFRGVPEHPRRRADSLERAEVTAAAIARALTAQTQSRKLETR